MKKLALASAVALISTGANAQPTLVTGDIIVGGVSIAVPCSSTWSGGADGMIIDAAAGTLMGTVCLDPTGTGSPYVMLGISLGGNGTTGAIQIATDWNTGPGWVNYAVVNATTTIISCTRTSPPPRETCITTILSTAATLIAQ